MTPTISFGVETFGFEAHLDLPDDEFAGIDFERPAYATGKRKQPQRETPLKDLGPPPKDIAALVSGKQVRRTNRYVKIDFADWGTSLDGLSRRDAARAKAMWGNLLSHQEIRKKTSTGVVRSSTKELMSPTPLGKHAAESGIALLVRAGLVVAYQSSKRESRVYVLTPVYLRYLSLSGSHVASLTGSHVGQENLSSGSHVGQYPGGTTPTQASESSSSLVAPLLSTSGADYAAASEGAGAARPAAAAKPAKVSTIKEETTREFWDRLLGKGNYMWKEVEDEPEVIIQTVMFFNDEQSQDRALLMQWRVDTITGLGLLSFPAREKLRDTEFPFGDVGRVAARTWQEFTGKEQENHPYTTWDFVVCMERLAYEWAQRPTKINRPVGWLDNVAKDILNKAWGECQFTDHRFSMPRPKKAV